MNTTLRTLRRACLTLALCGLALTGRSQQADEQDKALAPDEKTYILSKFWSEVKYNFVYFNQIGEARWDSLYRAYLPKVQQTPDNRAFYNEMRRFCALLKDGHTNIMWNNYPCITTFFDQLQWYISDIEGKAIVTSINELNRKRIPIGTEIVKVNGLPTQTYLEQHVLPLFSSSTDYVRRDMAVSLMLQGLRGESYDVELLTPDKKTLKLHLTHKIQEPVYSDPLYPKEDEWKRLELKWYPGNVAYVALNTFSNPAIVDDFVKIFPTLQQRAKKLIIDLRYNGGGSTGTGSSILQYLTPDTLLTGSKWCTRDYAASYAAWGEYMTPEDTVGDSWSQRCYLTARGEYYVGHDIYTVSIPPSHPRLVVPTVILIDHNTASAAEDFLILADGQKHFTKIGRPSNGSTGQPIVIDLGHGFSARICTKKDTYADGRLFVGCGVQPDIVVEPTVKDLIKGRDGQLEAALKFLKKQK